MVLKVLSLTEVHGHVVAALLAEMQDVKGPAFFENCETEVRHIVHHTPVSFSSLRAARACSCSTSLHHLNTCTVAHTTERLHAHMTMRVFCARHSQGDTGTLRNFVVMGLLCFFFSVVLELHVNELPFGAAASLTAATLVTTYRCVSSCLLRFMPHRSFQRVAVRQPLRLNIFVFTS